MPAARAQDRRALLERFGWPDDDTPLAVMVTRLTDQKGVDLVAPIVPVLRHVPMRLAVLGIGRRRRWRATLAGLAADHPASFAFVEAYDEALAHLLFAGGDLFVMPSRFEPCGLAADAGDALRRDPGRHRRRRARRHRARRRRRRRTATASSPTASTGVGVVSALFRAARLLADRRRRVAARAPDHGARLVVAGSRRPSTSPCTDASGRPRRRTTGAE